MTPPVSVPSLDELAADPGKAAALPQEAARLLWFQCLTIQQALVPALVSPGKDHLVGTLGEDRLLRVKEAAKRLGMSPDWLYRNADSLPFKVRQGRTLRFSAQGIDRHIRQRQGR